MTLTAHAAFRTFEASMTLMMDSTSRSLDPSIGILLNVTEDHLERHGVLRDYAAILLSSPSHFFSKAIGLR